MKLGMQSKGRALWIGVRLVGLLLSAVLPNQSRAENAGLDRRIQEMLVKSLPRLACNLSTGLPGSIVASPQTQDPNYYFHWIRDSALVIQALSRLVPYVTDTSNEVRIRQLIGDFISLSTRLQHSPGSYGFGETRFNVDGSIDESTWPRPQFDGPALRAMALLDYLGRAGAALDAKTVAAAEAVVRRDLDATARHHSDKGFDLWEFSRGFHFYTRMVQEGALLRGEGYFKNRAKPEWQQAADELRLQLNHHWHAEFGTIGDDDLSSGPSTDQSGGPVDDSESAFSTSAVLAVNHADLWGQGFDDLDGRVWSSLWKQQDYFRKNFPFNAIRRLGPGIGRGPDDDYYGGNAFFFLTAAFAEHDFRVASRLMQQEGVLLVDKNRLPTLRHVLTADVKEGTKFALPSKELADAFAREGEAFLQTILDVTPPDGSMSEQFSKENGSPVSAKDLSWSYASVLTAILAREEWSRSSVDFSEIDFKCPSPP
jgi:glucoamylase